METTLFHCRSYFVITICNGTIHYYLYFVYEVWKLIKVAVQTYIWAIFSSPPTLERGSPRLPIELHYAALVGHFVLTWFVTLLKIDKKFHFDHDEGQDLAKMTTTTHYQRRLLLLLMHISCVDALEEKMFIFISM